MGTCGLMIQRPNDWNKSSAIDLAFGKLRLAKNFKNICEVSMMVLFFVSILRTEWLKPQVFQRFSEKFHP